MTSGNLLIVNHALYFSDLALRMAGVNYLPKHDLLILDEAHTVEDVAGSHFGLKVSEAGIKYQLRSLFDVRRGRGMLSVHGGKASDAIGDVVDLGDRAERFFGRCADWHDRFGKGTGRVREAAVVENDLTPKLRDLSLHIKAMLPGVEGDEEIAELTNAAAKVGVMAEAVDAILKQSMDDAVYWMDVSGGGKGQRGGKRVTLHAAPVNVAEGLRKYLFKPMKSVVMTSATLSTGRNKAPGRGAGFQPVSANAGDEAVQIRQGACLPDWIREGAVYSVTFRLADSLPEADSRPVAI